MFSSRAKHLRCASGVVREIQARRTCCAKTSTRFLRTPTKLCNFYARTGYQFHRNSPTMNPAIPPHVTASHPPWIPSFMAHHRASPTHVFQPATLYTCIWHTSHPSLPFLHCNAALLGRHAALIVYTNRRAYAVHHPREVVLFELSRGVNLEAPQMLSTSPSNARRASRKSGQRDLVQSGDGMS